MIKLIATLPALALVFALSTTASANEGLHAADLAGMGLAGIEVMSDDAGMAIRGKGWRVGKKAPKKHAGDKPWSLAFGLSYATVGGAGSHDDNPVPAVRGGKPSGFGSAGAGTRDGFLAEGRYMASGKHFSEAGRTITHSHELQVKGKPATLKIRTKSIHVFAGGFATASSL